VGSEKEQMERCGACGCFPQGHRGSTPKPHTCIECGWVPDSTSRIATAERAVIDAAERWMDTTTPDDENYALEDLYDSIAALRQARKDAHASEAQ
jgi:hypothetical protein